MQWTPATKGSWLTWLGEYDGRLYAEGFVDRTPILEVLHPTNGHPTQRRANLVGPLAMADGLIWVWQTAGTVVTQGKLLGIDPRTLATRETIDLGTPHDLGQASVLGARGRTLVIEAGNVVVLVGPGGTQRRFTIPTPSTYDPLLPGSALSPDGSRLYELWIVDPDNGGPQELDTLDSTTGIPIASSRNAGNPARFNGSSLVPTADGLWLSTTTGPSAWVAGAWRVQLLVAGQRPRLVASGDGNPRDGQLLLTPTLSGGVMWFYADNAVICADPDTGRIRARAALTSGRRGFGAELEGVGVIHDRLYSLYGSGNPTTKLSQSTLIEMTPPSACFKR